MSNFATLNPLGITNSNQSLSEGNLVHTVSGQWLMAYTNFAMKSGKFYAEWTVIDNTSFFTGIIDGNQDGQESIYFANTANSGYVGKYNDGFGWQGDGSKYTGNSSASLGSSASNGDIIMVAFDATNRKIWWGKNGTWFEDGPAAGTNPAYDGSQIPESPVGYHFASACENANGRWNFGQFPWRYDPPSGFLALSTDNLAEPPISNLVAEKPNDHFGVIVYEGQGGSRDVTDTDAVNFTPDLVWIKHRQDTSSHSLFDSVRGVGKYITSDGNGAEATEAQSLTAFVNGGFSVGTEPNSPRTDESGGTPNHVAWCWKAGGTAVSNTDGSITSQVSANTDSGFSIVSYTGNGTAGSTVGHGLNAAPKIIFVKNRTVSENWAVSTANITGTTNGSLWLNLTNAEAANSGWWDGGAPGISTFEVGINQETNVDTHQYIAYCWHSVEGFSSIGSYIGNGSADGSFVYTGFKPRFLLFKKSSATDRWFMADTARSPFNVTLNDEDGGIKLVDAAGTDAEFANSPAEDFDIVSNGFKFRINDGGSNGSGATYIYMAFAESPFKYSSAR